jgi:hypothetical protein
MTIQEAALQYHRTGLHVIPVNPDKRPTGPWKQFQAQQTEEDVRRLFSGNPWGLAILTGPGGLEVIDVDEKHDPTKSIFVRYVKYNDLYSGNECGILDMPVQSTMNGGYHVLYRCRTIEGNQKLAMRIATDEELAAHNATVERPIDDPAKLPQCLIETRGTGGYVVAHPTPGYEMQYGDLTNIPTITERQRFYLLQAARAFNEVTQKSKPDTEVPRINQPSATGGKTVIDDFNDKNHAVDLLCGYGWTVVSEDGERVHLKRPGNSDAKTSGNFHKGRGVFMTFSTSTALEAEKGYSAFGIYAAMEHGGDAKAAVKDLGAQGYGESLPAPIERVEPATEQEQPAVERKQEHIGDLLAFVKSTRFDILAPIKEEHATLTLDNEGKIWKLGGFGMIGAVVGAQKAGKSVVASCIVASALADGDRKLGFGMEMRGKNIAFFDTEQSGFFYKKTQERIHHLAGIYSNRDYYEAYHLRRLNPRDRVRAIGAMLAGRKDLGLVVIDGIVDLCDNFNDETASARTMEHLMRWSDETGALFLTVLHLTKSEGFMRGHLGTALQNKYDFGIEVLRDRNTNIFDVKCRETRFAPFPGFSFLRDEKGMPYIEGTPAPSYHADAWIEPGRKNNEDVPF